MKILPVFYWRKSMKLIEVIGSIDALKKNQIEDDTKRKWISDLESLIIREIILTHEMPEWVKDKEAINRYLETDGKEDVYGADTEGNAVLLAEPPYDDVYFWYLAAKIDLAEGDMERYQNDHQMYNNAYLTFQDYYNRTYMPVQKVYGFMRGSACGTRRERNVSAGDETNRPK